MADTSGMADIRGLDIQKLAISYAEEASIFKSLINVSNTSAREIRWYRKTAGILDSTDTTGITASQIANVAFGARPVIVEQSWTRYTSYVRKYFVESPTIAQEDIDDCDVDILAQNLKDLVIAVEYQVDQRIWNVMTESQSTTNQTILSGSTAAAWDTASWTGVKVVDDIMTAVYQIRNNSGFDPIKEGGVLLLNPKDHKNMLSFLIDSKGSSIPAWSSEKIGEGKIQTLLGLRVIVSNNVTADFACIAIPKMAVTWKQFVPISTAVITDEGIGKKIRVWEEGEVILNRPKCVYLLYNTAA